MRESCTNIFVTIQPSPEISDCFVERAHLPERKLRAFALQSNISGAAEQLHVFVTIQPSAEMSDCFVERAPLPERKFRAFAL